MSRSMSSSLWHRIVASVMLLVAAVEAQAQILFVPGTSFVQSDITISATGGVGGVLSPPALVAPTQLIEVDNGPAIGGIKVSSMDLAFWAWPPISARRSQ